MEIKGEQQFSFKESVFRKELSRYLSARSFTNLQLGKFVEDIVTFETCKM